MRELNPDVDQLITIPGMIFRKVKKMNEIHYGISQETLVSNIEHQSVPAKRLPQYIASLAATLGALANGMILAWTSSAGEDGKDLQSLYNITISKDEFSWISSLAVVGSAIMCIPIGILADIIGRKGSMLLMVIPFTIGWLLLIFANNLAMFYFGRFITGLSGAVFCVVAPIYTAEIAENEIRGSVGNYFPLLLTVGILLSYLLGTFVNMRILSIVSATIPVVFFVVFMFMPESPIYYLKKGLEDSAKKSLIRLRGVEYDIETELQHQKDALKENKNTVSFWTLIHQRATLKGFIVAYGLMFFQQLCGVNVAGSTLDSHYLTIIIGAMQILAVFVSTLTVDRVGRRILLLASIICSGFGPLPWMMLGELFAAEVKGVAASSACFLNAVLGFTVTKFFSNLTNAIGIGPTFWLFTVVCVIGMFFVYLLVPETKGKSLGDIQKELNGY
ncbi:hypothetical protein E2986_02846 [Frieseomelitta varia]|uniref:Major facilitator superfamily (MFS) profile domain-containing protein n=1 Tax=Frieseomelitta varia TaxID=561572 RepID=A0A833VRX5_9HYME|nr:hypothetical protein E2986_02846 [Frieseomelitta varia]